MAVTPFTQLESTALTAGYTLGDTSITVASTGSPMPAAAPFYVYLCDKTTGVVIVVLRVSAIASPTSYTTAPAGTDRSAANGSLVVLSYAPLASIIAPGDFSALGVNGGGSAVTQIANYLQFHLVPSGTNIGGFGVAPPGAGATCDIRGELMMLQGGISVDVGLVVFNSANGHFLHFAYERNDGLLVAEYTAAGTFVGNAFALIPPVFSNPMWLRISCDGTTLFFWVGDVLGNWFQVFSQALATFLGAFPTSLGVAMQNSTAAVNVSAFNLQVTGT